MTALEMMEKAKKMMEKAKAVEKAEKEKNILALGKILKRHVDEDFTNCTVQNLRLECTGIVGTDAKSEKKKAVNIAAVEEQ